MADFESSWTYLEGSIWIENDDGTFTRKMVAEADGWLYEWLTSIYWAVTTMTTIGNLVSLLTACDANAMRREGWVVPYLSWFREF